MGLLKDYFLLKCVFAFSDDFSSFFKSFFMTKKVEVWKLGNNKNKKWKKKKTNNGKGF